MGDPFLAKVLTLPLPYRPPRGPVNRDVVRQRLTDDFARGDMLRRIDTAHGLTALARELHNGEHGELILTLAAKLLEVRAKAKAAS